MPTTPLLPQRRAFALYAITRHGLGLAEKLAGALPQADLFVSERVRGNATRPTLPLPLPMGPTLSQNFAAYDCHVFVISVGAVVRMIAPLLVNKKVDPAVVCVDDAGRFAICVLSGHVGRGNAFTERTAAALGATAVITTASDVQGTLTVDILGRELGWRLDDPDRNVTAACAAVVNQERVAFVQETGEPDFWPLSSPLPEGVEYLTSLEAVNPEDYNMLLIASDRDLARSHPRHFDRAVVYRPRSLVLGIGCDKDTSAALVERGMLHILSEQGLFPGSVKALATIDLKADEPALRELSHQYGWPLVTYPARELDAVAGVENPSEVVKRHVGTRSVAEAACLLHAGAERLLMPKRAYTEPGAARSMTLAAARIPFPNRSNRLGATTET